mmetsp:Transcript_30225/g.55823  ORF Transcript_30225/g.55823 Transcript_30225/m.55823 type:complete len:286 (+) Transcript_30225:429-1286(+)
MSKVSRTSMVVTIPKFHPCLLPKSSVINQNLITGVNVTKGHVLEGQFPRAFHDIDGMILEPCIVMTTKWMVLKVVIEMIAMFLIVRPFEQLGSIGPHLRPTNLNVGTLSQSVPVIDKIGQRGRGDQVQRRLGMSKSIIEQKLLSNNYRLVNSLLDQFLSMIGFVNGKILLAHGNEGRGQDHLALTNVRGGKDASSGIRNGRVIDTEFAVRETDSILIEPGEGFGNVVQSFWMVNLLVVVIAIVCHILLPRMKVVFAILRIWLGRRFRTIHGPAQCHSIPLGLFGG